MPTDKMLPRNRTARLAQARAAGNPAVTELESGVGNCFPGLELDLRNLERRFFPHLCVDFVGGQVVVTEVELAAARVALTPGPLLNALTRIAADLPSATWRITALSGEFSGHGTRSWRVRDLGADSSTPSDAWTAVRLLRPGTEVLVSLAREPLTAAGPNRFDLRAVRVSYLTDDGAFAEMFEPGELTQSLCSPWTHDFRDCGCWYWASNHPDLVQPALPPGIAADDPRWGRRTLWLRSDRELDPPAPADVNHTGEMLHHEINSRWEDLDIVVDGREQRIAYEPSALTGTPLPPQQLIATLRYAAAVELAVMLEYLSAVYSLNPSAGATGSELRADARAARAELLRVRDLRDAPPARHQRCPARPASRRARRSAICAITRSGHPDSRCGGRARPPRPIPSIDTDNPVGLRQSRSTLIDRRRSLQSDPGHPGSARQRNSRRDHSVRHGRGR